MWSYLLYRTVLPDQVEEPGHVTPLSEKSHQMTQNLFYYDQV